MEKPNEGLGIVGVEIRTSKPSHKEIVIGRKVIWCLVLINVKCCDIEPSRESWPSLPAYEVVVLKKAMKQLSLKYVEMSSISSLMVSVVLSVLSKCCPNYYGSPYRHPLPATIARRNL